MCKSVMEMTVVIRPLTEEEIKTKVSIDFILEE
jgi:hypothetical protein